MKRPSVLCALAGAILLSMTPLSLRWSHSLVLPLTVAPASAKAAELEMAPRRVAYRHGRYYRAALYDPWCGGPYAHSGWNGGTYWGGPWVDLRCYGVR
jgi:hypothetical protein